MPRARTKIYDRVLACWRNGEPDKRSDSFWTDGMNFFSYATCLFSWRYQVLNTTRYSATTTRYQRALEADLNELVPSGYRVTGQPRGLTAEQLAGNALEEVVRGAV